jgi:putative sigma-54 modulation protein
MVLHVHPKTKNTQITDETRLYLEKRLSKLKKQFRHEPEVHYTQGFERGLYNVEVTLNNDGVLLRSQERSSDLHAALDNMVEKLETQWQRYKGKRTDGHRHSSAIKAEAEAALEPEEETFVPRIVRRKNFPMKSMTPEEAARQMELLGHDFFVFLDEENGRLAVLYKREDGDYGLIEPSL